MSQELQSRIALVIVDLQNDFLSLKVHMPVVKLSVLRQFCCQNVLCW